MELVKVRECDQQCCKDSPRWPEGGDCKYRRDNGCGLMLGEPIPEGNCPALPHMTAEEGFTYSCLNWPHNMPGRQTGNCCWQWVEQ